MQFEIQAMIRQYIEKVTVFESHIEVTYKIAVLLPDEKNNENRLDCNH